MKVVEHLDRATEPLISFEIIPPLRGGDFAQLVAVIEELVRFRPPFIDITSHAAETVFEETADGIRKKVKRKRPGTLGVCALIQNKYDVDAVPHLLCHGFTREETEDVLIEFRYLGIDNVFAVRGDALRYKKVIEDHRTVNQRASDLVGQIADMNAGRYLEEDLLDADATDFCIGVAGYPEKHFEAPNLDVDVRYIKAKVDAGAQYIVTQMFFENRYFFDFVERCRAAGITVPIIPGLKILSTRSQLENLPGTFHVEVPGDLYHEITAAKDGHVATIGVEWAARQVEELLDRGVPALHLFVMQNSRVVSRLMTALGR